MSSLSDLVSVRSTELNSGKSLLLALILTVVSAALIFILSKVLFIHQDFLGSIYENGVPRALAGLFLAIFPYIHQRLAGKRRFSFSNLPDEVVPFGAYTLPWYILLAYGVLIAFAMAGLSLFLVWLVGIATGFFVTRAISILNLIILFVTFYYLGSWMGSRSARCPYPTAVGIVLGYTVLELLVTVVLNIDSPLRSPFVLVIFLSLSLVAALIGALIGTRRRLLNYIRFLFGPLSEKDRQALVYDLYWEVKQRIGGLQEFPEEQDGRE
jgi:hypothetical protein